MLYFISDPHSVDPHKIKAIMHFIKLIFIMLMAKMIETKLVNLQGCQAATKTSADLKKQLFFGYHVPLREKKSAIDKKSSEESRKTNINTTYQQTQSRRKLWHRYRLKSLITRIKTRTLNYGLSFHKKLFL